MFMFIIRMYNFHTLSIYRASTIGLNTSNASTSHEANNIRDIVLRNIVFGSEPDVTASG